MTCSMLGKENPGIVFRAGMKSICTGLRGLAIETCEGRQAMNDWGGRAGEELLRLRGNAGVWGYRTDRGPSAETTALACLGLWTSRSDPSSPARGESIERGADWLESLQNTDGSLGISPTLPTPCWSTPYAILVWNILKVHDRARKRAVAWLLAHRGSPVAVEAAYLGSVVGHDPNLIGWPWIEGTHSWLEPTAMAILALERESLGDHPRVIEGIGVILNRALAQGGWNYGNTSVFGRQLRPQPGPTGLALLALAAHASKNRPRSVDPAIAYLVRTLPEVRAPISLAWGVLGLRAWNASPPAAEEWLSESYALYSGRRDVTTGLSLLLLASGYHSLVPGELRS